MKKCLFAIVLLYTSQYALADATFKYSSLKGNNSKHLLTYFIKAQQLKYTETSSNKDNVFNHKIQQFTSLDQKTGSLSSLNNEILNAHVMQLNQQRMQKLQSVEKELNIKLKDMSAVQQQAGESLINQLKYPDLYGEHTLMTIKPVKKTKQVNKIECKQYQLYKKSTLIREYCLATPQALGISDNDYQTLRSFYSFDYKMQSKIMIAMGKTGFTIIDFEQQNMPGIVIEIINYNDKLISHHLVLEAVNTDSLDKDIFNIKQIKK